MVIKGVPIVVCKYKIIYLCIQLYFFLRKIFHMKGFALQYGPLHVNLEKDLRIEPTVKNEMVGKNYMWSELQVYVFHTNFSNLHQ